MPDPALPPQQPPPQQPQPKRGCWFYGCLTLAVLALLVGIGAWLAARYALKSASGLINQYTSTNPVPIETVTISQTELKSLQDRVASFAQTLNGQKGAPELILSADEINALIQNDPQYRDLKNKLYVMLDGDQVKGKLSMPLEDIGPLKLKGRYLNGTASITVALDGGSLDVRLKQVDVGGKPLPGAILTQLKSINFAQDVQKDPNASKSLEKLESIQVKDSKVIIRAKQPEKP
jgi:hypothetical protein